MLFIVKIILVTVGKDNRKMRFSRETTNDAL